MKRIALLTSGGDSPGMNAAIRAVVRAGNHYGLEVFGVLRGFQGLIDDKFIPMSPRDVGGIINRGGTILYSARSKAFMEAQGRALAAKHLQERGIDGLVAIGGDGTYRGADLLTKEHGVRCIGLPGTIDNDIGGTDFSIGFDTALNTALEAIDRLRDTAESHDRIFFVEVMGRHSGYIAMMSGIAGGAEQILVPEIPTDIGQLIHALESGRARGKNSMIVVVAEGDDAGSAADIACQVSEQSSFSDMRVAVVGHLQRGGSPTAFDRILASRLGVRAVEALVEGKTGLMVGMSKGEVVLRPFSDAWELPSRFAPELLDLMQILSR